MTLIKERRIPEENLTLITGGARSGKSKLAEKIASESGLPVHYIATMVALDKDGEIDERVNRHRSRRPETWVTVEAPLAVSEAIAEIPDGPGMVLIDCLSVYVSNLLLQAGADDPYTAERDILVGVSDVLTAIERRPDLRFVIVTNEVGWSVVPENALARAYRDFLGIVNQMYAGEAGTVFLVCSGLNLKVKPQPVSCSAP